jgi:hypothetical protein
MGDAMEDSVRMFLDEHRTTSRWLDDIIDVLLKMRGSAHVNAIARELSKSYRRDIDTVEQTVTRRINDFCSDAADFRKPKKYDLCVPKIRFCNIGGEVHRELGVT